MTTKKTVLVTGCLSGIGHALAVEFHSQGLSVFAISRSLHSMKTLADKGIELLQLDVTNPGSIYQTREEIIRRTGGNLDILVNNTGQWLESLAIETDISLIKGLFDVNLFGAMEMVRQFSSLLVPMKGIIVNHSSPCSHALSQLPHGTWKSEAEFRAVRILKYGQNSTGIGPTTLSSGLFSDPELSVKSSYEKAETFRSSKFISHLAPISISASQTL